MIKFVFYFMLLTAPVTLLGQTYKLEPLTDTGTASFRGMSIVSDQVAWISGSNGTIGRTIDGGKTWKWIQPKGYERLDFRDIEAFDGNKAIVVNAGSPAYVLLTSDGGVTWKETYKNTDSAIFLDGMDFWDENTGIIFGDPINNKMQLLKTRDGGLNWQDVSGNLKAELASGEAGFAASGTSIRTYGEGIVWIATGGTVSNIYRSDNYGYTWSVFKCPIWQGESSTGPFSLAVNDQKTGVVVGGNYLKDQENTNNVLLTLDGGETWIKPRQAVAGYRSGVMYVDKQTLFATGSSGTDVSLNGGYNWHKISDLGFNVIQKAKTGSLILLAGNKGQLYRLKIEDVK